MLIALPQADCEGLEGDSNCHSGDLVGSIGGCGGLDRRRFGGRMVGLVALGLLALNLDHPDTSGC